MSFNDRNERWSVPVFLAGLTLFFYWKIIFTGRVMFPWDAVDFFYPYFSFVHEELRHFRLPLWDPYVMSGYPIIGDPESQTFYPGMWLMVLLHPFSYLPYKLVEVVEILHFFLAGLFMYYLAKSFVRSSVAALFGAVLFMFSGAMVAHTEHLASIESMAWYPLVFLLARRGLLENKSWATVAAGFFFGIQILTGHWQHSAYLGLLLFLYFIYEACFGPLRTALWPRWIFALLTIASVGACLAMVQVIPTHELGNLSVRSYLTYADVTNGNQPRFLWTLILPNFFGGLNGVPQWYEFDLSFNYAFLTLPGCVLAILGLVETARRRNYFWIGLVLLTLDLALGRNGHMAWLLYHTPVLGLFRNASTFFDLTNFALCLMAAIGAEALFSGSLSELLRKHLATALAGLLFAAIAYGLVEHPEVKIHGWYHMLAAFAVTALILAAQSRQKLLPYTAQWLFFGVMVFELCFYNMNQVFNWTKNKPATYVTHDLAMGGAQTLRFLRSDRGEDFRVAAFAEYPWSANGWNVWRLRGIFGWNPITLLRYEDYIRGFINTSDYTLPYGGPDHNLDSSMLDLLGVKYVIAADPVLEKRNISLRPSSKFELVLEDQGWWRTYRNKNYLSKAALFRKAYVLPSHEETIAAMSSNFFDGRKLLLFEKGDVPPQFVNFTEELPNLTFAPGSVSALSSGSVMNDPQCAATRPMLGGWGEKKGDSFQYAVPASPTGRYALLMEYTAAGDVKPSLRTEVKDDQGTQISEAVTLPGTSGWDCREWRTTQLGSFEIRGGSGQLTVRAANPADIHIYSMWMVRLPEPPPVSDADFFFDHLSVFANHIVLEAHPNRSGFLLLNEIYYPGWRATIDGQETEILRADDIFRAIYVPAGSHRIDLRFRPRNFINGAIVSFLTAIGLAGFAFVFRKKKQSSGEIAESAPARGAYNGTAVR